MGMTASAVARRVHRDRRTVRRWWTRYQQDGSHWRNAGSVRPRKPPATLGNDSPQPESSHVFWRQAVSSAVQYVDEIVEAVVVPNLQECLVSNIFQQDNEDRILQDSPNKHFSGTTSKSYSLDWSITNRARLEHHSATNQRSRQAFFPSCHSRRLWAANRNRIGLHRPAGNSRSHRFDDMTQRLPECSNKCGGHTHYWFIVRLFHTVNSSLVPIQ